MRTSCDISQYILNPVPGKASDPTSLSVEIINFVNKKICQY